MIKLSPLSPLTHHFVVPPLPVGEGQGVRAVAAAGACSPAWHLLRLAALSPLTHHFVVTPLPVGVCVATEARAIQS